MNRLFYILILFNFLYTEIVYEQGELSKFFGGEAPGSEYDNWLSHTTEGIAEIGYNDYGPEFIDIQTNGFGNHQKLVENSPILSYWENIFQNFIEGDLDFADSLLQDSIETFFYKVIVFDDTVENKTYHLLREGLDSSFVDINQVDINSDDVIGSFRNSWGLYIINPLATKKQVIIQVPHPCDDFIAPYIALDIFIQTDALAFMINSTGREVIWSQDGNYLNSKSQSDPSRYAFTVFQKFQETITEPLFNSEPHSPLVFAIHSFDNESHLERNSVILAAGGQKPLTTKPIRDISSDKFDIINFTSEFPITQNQFGDHNSVHITNYYEAFYDDVFTYENEDGDEGFEITLATELKGPLNGVQMIDLQSKVNYYSVYEPWVHIELDEKPKLFDSLGLSNDSLYLKGIYPTGIQNFSKIREYYQPFINALNSYLIHWENILDQNSPGLIQNFHAQNLDNPNQIKLDWIPINDTNFKTFEIQKSTDSLMTNPLSYDFEDYEELQNMRSESQIINGINSTQPWYFRIRALDHFSNEGPWSEVVSNQLPGHSPPDTILSYDQNTLVNSYPGEDSDILNYLIDTEILMPGNSPTLFLYGNSWKSISIIPFQLDSTTVIQIFVKIDSVSEIQGLCLGNEDSELRYAFNGSEILNIENWIPVFQGSFQNNDWNTYRLPIGDDWLAKYDSLNTITQISFVNDHDDSTTNPGSIHFSFIRDITSDLFISPTVRIETNFEQFSHSNIREIITVSFNSIIDDIDSEFFLYDWDFGDGTSSNLKNPSHDFIFGEDQEYSILLIVEDETGLQGWKRTTLGLDSLNNNPTTISMNFVGDIMMGRRFEESNGIIANQGANALFEPTYNILGLAADITVANLEVTLTDQETPHPTKGIIFKSNPENVNALVYAGIDVVSLANNHILDFMEPGLIQTQNTLSQAGIKFSGAGMNSHEAYLPTFKSIKGKTIAFLASSDRTGQYNNYQPYLHAGENKSGFAYMTPYYLRKQIESVKHVADLIILELHAGSEYSYEPGSDYDYNTSSDDFSTMRFNPASNVGFENLELEEEDYSWRLDNPHSWDRSIRQFSIDEGADLVIVHHPHIIQGVEIYNGKLIAHSLGNFIFDLNYPETYPSLILNSKANETGFFDYSLTPLYIDDYLTKPATGELANYILNYIANQSKKLNTYVHVDIDNHIAHVVIDTFLMQRENLVYDVLINNSNSININGITLYESEPIPLSKAGSLSGILNTSINYRLGREKIWMNNFEDEGSSLWNLNSVNESIQDSIFRRGNASVLHKRDFQSPDNIVTNLEEKIPIRNGLDHTLHGFIKTENSKDVTLELKSSINRTGEFISTVSIQDSITGTTPWTKYWGNIPLFEESEFVNIRLNSSIPDTGNAYSWFDDVGLIEWDSVETNPTGIEYPNSYDYIQFYFSEPLDEVLNISLQNTIIGSLSELKSNPKVVNPVITVPGRFYFYDNSEGPVGNLEWTIDDNPIANTTNPQFYCEIPGIYEVKLLVYGPNQQNHESSIIVIALDPSSTLNNKGDLNGDGSVTLLDVLICSNAILEFYNLEPEEFLAADLDNNGVIDLFDIILIIDIIN